MRYQALFKAVVLGAFLITPVVTNPAPFPQRNGQGGKNQASTQVAGAAQATAANAATATNVAADKAVANKAAANKVAGGNAGERTLDPVAVQTGSQSNGQAASGVAAGQTPSETDNANFINYCKGKTLTNGLQNKKGSCNGIVMGDVPAQANMVSTIITSPKPGEDLKEGTTFNVVLQTSGLEAGSFTNPDVTYYAAPQELKNGRIIGHTHVTIQSLGSSITPNKAPNPATFAFFKGVNDVGNDQGLLTAVVKGGLPAGNYRVCTLSSASNHQPVLMPVAQRGAQDDCTKFTVSKAGGAGGSAVGGATGAKAGADNSATGSKGTGTTDSSNTATPASASDTATKATASAAAASSQAEADNGNKDAAKKVVSPAAASTAQAKAGNGDNEKATKEASPAATASSGAEAGNDGNAKVTKVAPSAAVATSKAEAGNGGNNKATEVATSAAAATSQAEAGQDTYDANGILKKGKAKINPAGANNTSGTAVGASAPAKTGGSNCES